ncbi:MAG: hypothetical protein LBJ08_00675 [Bifidobacteriaceae bacterium]|nr:hypothetical protein [Bifidobacteriaceae bacterium]
MLYAAATLAAAGLRVGSIASPGLRSGRDRIRIDGAALSPADYRIAAQIAASALAELPPPASPADYVAPAALYLLAGVRFLASRCDVIVAEAGIGGASDELSLLPLTHLAATVAFLEHTALLGPTVRMIAADKVGAAGAHTRAICFLDDAGPLAAAARRRAVRLGAEACAVEPPASVGLSERNAQLGIALGRLIASGLGHELDPGRLSRVLASVRNPGRGSAHLGPEGGRVIVDSAITGEGLTAALALARERWGGRPDRILVSLPADKDTRGFESVLAPHRDRVVFVALANTHLVFPSQIAWAGRYATDSDLPNLLRGGDILAVGTALFTGAVLSTLNVSTETLFRSA